jgi:hypothetical protein
MTTRDRLAGIGICLTLLWYAGRRVDPRTVLIDWGGSMRVDPHRIDGKGWQWRSIPIPNAKAPPHHLPWIERA